METGIIPYQLVFLARLDGLRRNVVVLQSKLVKFLTNAYVCVASPLLLVLTGVVFYLLHAPTATLCSGASCAWRSLRDISLFAGDLYNLNGPDVFDQVVHAQLRKAVG
jgi:hypothetical protein